MNVVVIRATEVFAQRPPLSQHYLAAEAVETTLLTLEGIDHILGSDGIVLRLFTLRDSVAETISRHTLSTQQVPS